MPPGPRDARPDDRLPHRTRNLEIPGLRLAAHPGMTVDRFVARENRYTPIGSEPEGRLFPDHALKAPHLRFGLRAPQIIERVCGLFGTAKFRAEIAAHLRHAEHRFGRDIAF